MEASSAKHMYFKFHDHTVIAEFSTANISFGCKGKATKTEGKVMKYTGK